MTENRNRRRKKRPAYDQAKDAQRRRSANGVRSQNSSHPITNPNFDPDAPRPSRYTERSVDYGSGYPDNSIQFPTQTQSQPRRPAQGQGSNTVIQVDGGITPDTLPGAYAAGARSIVAGSAVFYGNIYQNVCALRSEKAKP